MDINVAATAGTLAAQINTMQAAIAELTQAQTEVWSLVSCVIQAPPTGTALPVAQISLLPVGQASQTVSAEAISVGLQTLQSLLTAAQAQLAGM